MTLRPRFREEMVKVITAFLRDSFRDAGRSTAIVGMSGGIDSSLVAKLCADALGPRNVLGMSLHEEESADPAGREDAEAWARALGIRFEAHDITPLVRAFQAHLAIADRKLLGNVKARVRMIVLYHRAGELNGLVVGTGNKSECCLGYYSKFGDGGVDLLPIGDLYKTQVREMARHLGLPQRIVEKPPTAGLWKGQTDEGELGITYDELDPILLGIEMELDPREIAREAGVTLAQVERIEAMVRAAAHKRRPPLIPKVGIRTFGLDWREY
jgi:NAD+ synthase